MILTQDKINNAVIKAFCKMADKSVKYYKGLSVGVNNDCLLKEAVLLNQYVDNIKCFKIIGSTEQCDCCIEGDYKVILPNDKIYYFQFGCDGNGYLLTEDNGGYDFTYCYDETNNQLVMSYDVDYSYQSYFEFGNLTSSTAFAVYVNSTIIYGANPISYNDFLDAFNSSNILGYSLINDGGSRTIIRKNGFYTNDDVQVLDGDSVFNLILGMVDEGPLVIKFEDVDFTEECNFSYSGVFPWYYNSELEVTGTPILTDDGLITIEDPLGNDIVTPLVIPIALLTDPEDIVDYWNDNRASTNFTLSYNGTEYIMESPADFVNYYSHTFNFTQLETVNVIIPGVNATASATNTFAGAQDRRNKTISALVNGSLVGSYTIGSADISDTAAQLAVKLENALTYTGASFVVGATINLISPVANASYNGYIFRLQVDTVGNTRIVAGILPLTGDTISIFLDSDSQLIGQIIVGTPSQWNTDLANSINATAHLGIQSYVLGPNDVAVIAPPLSGTSFNGETLTATTIGTVVINPIAAFFGGTSTSTLINENPFSGGINPTTTPEIEPVTYTSEFNVIVDDELTYENLNPCFEELTETARILVTGNPVLSGYNGFITINNYNNDPVYSLTIPSNIITNPSAIVDLWNSTMTYTGFTLAYENGEYIFTSPVDNNYVSWTAQFKQYEGGQSSNTLLVDPIPQPFITSGIPATTTILVTGSDMLNNSTTQNFNLNSNLLFAHSGQFTTPESVETFFNTNTIDYSIQYDGPQLGPEVLATASNNFIGTAFTNPSETVEIYIDFSNYTAPGWKSGVNYIGEYVIQPGDTQTNIWSGLRDNIINRPNGITTTFIVNAVPTPGDILNIVHSATGTSILGGAFTAGSYLNIAATAQALRDVINLVPGNIWSAQSNINVSGDLIITLNPSTPGYANYTGTNLVANNSLGPSWSFVDPIRRLMRNYITEGGGIAPLDPLNPYQITLTAFVGSGTNWNNPNVGLAIFSTIGNEVYTTFAGGQNPSPNGNYFYTVSSPDLDGFAYNGDIFSITYSSSPTIDFGSFSGGSSSTMGFLYWELILPSGSTVVYQDATTPVNYASLQEIVDAFNDSPNNFDFTATLQGNNIYIASPPNTFEFYNGSEVNLQYAYFSEFPIQEYNSEFENGVNPTLISYIGQFENQKPLVEQTCLTNEQVINIINNINKI